MLRINRLLTILLLVALILSACQPLVQPVAQQAALVPHFLRTACLYRISPDVNVICGYLIIPETRSQADGKTIRLHVVIFKNTSVQRQPDPLILLNGGPGSPGQPMSRVCSMTCSV